VVFNDDASPVMVISAMNNKRERSQQGKLKLSERKHIYYPCDNMEGVSKSTKTLRIIGVLFEIQTGHLPNISQKRHPLSQIILFTWLPRFLEMALPTR
jgi:hypothetical protein